MCIYHSMHHSDICSDPKYNYFWWCHHHCMCCHSSSRAHPKCNNYTINQTMERGWGVMKWERLHVRRSKRQTIPCPLTLSHRFMWHATFHHSHQALETHGAASNTTIVDIGHVICLIPCTVHINTQLTIINMNYPLPNQPLHEASSRLVTFSQSWVTLHSLCFLILFVHCSVSHISECYRTYQQISLLGIWHPCISW